MDRRKDLTAARDNHTHWKLVNWAIFQSIGADGPATRATSSSWQGQIVNPGDSIDEVEIIYIDEDDGARTQQAMMKFKNHDHKSANVLIRAYRDRWSIPGHKVKIARLGFWRWL